MSGNLGHARRILTQVVRHRLDALVDPDDIPRRLPRLALRTLNLLLPSPKQERGERLREALVAMGPVYIKLGQLLSTRRDLIPPDVADALALLQDQVDPIQGFSIHQFVSDQLGQNADELFAHIDTEPLASASIAQVYAAQLKDGSEVVIKVVRPGIRSQIDADMALIKALAAKLDDAIPGARRLRLPQIAADHEQVLLRELNMHSEGANQIQLRRNFAESDLLYVPRVYTPIHA